MKVNYESFTVSVRTELLIISPKLNSDEPDSDDFSNKCP